MARMNKTQLMNKVIEVTSNLKKGALSKEVTEELTYMIDLHTNHPKEVQPSDVRALIDNLAKEGVSVLPATTKKTTPAKKSKPTKKSTPAPAPADNTDANVNAVLEVEPKEEVKAPKKKAPTKKAKAEETPKPKAKETKPKAKPKAKVVKEKIERDYSNLEDAKGTMDINTFNAIANNKVVKFKEYIFPQAYECELGLLERRDDLKTLNDVNEEMQKGTDLIIMTYWTDQHLVECGYDPYEINKKLPKSFKDDFDICQIVFSSEKVLYAISLETEVMSTFPAKSFKHKKGTNYRVSNGMEYEVYQLRS